MTLLVSISVARHQARCELCGKAGPPQAVPAPRPPLRARVRALLSLRFRP